MAKAKPVVQDQPSLVERIDAQIIVAQRDQAEAERLYSEKSLALVERPGDARLHDELASFKSERDTATEKVKTLQVARAEAARRDSAEAEVAALTKLKADAAAVEQGLQEIAELANDMVERAAGLSHVKQRIDALALETRRLAYGVMRGAVGPRLAEKNAGVLSRLATAVDPELAAVLAPAVQGSVWIDVKRPFQNPSRSLADQLVRDNDAILSKVNELVSRREAELAGKVTEAPPTQADRFAKGGQAAAERKQAELAAAQAGESE